MTGVGLICFVLFFISTYLRILERQSWTRRCIEYRIRGNGHKLEYLAKYEEEKNTVKVSKYWNELSKEVVASMEVFKTGLDKVLKHLI